MIVCISGESQPILRQVLTTNSTPIVGGTNVVVVNNGTNLSINTPGGSGAALPWTAVATNLTAGKIPVIGTQKTNLQEAASSDLQSNLGNVYQSTNAALTALAGNPALYQATNAALTALSSNPNLYQSTNAALTALAANANLYQATNGNLTTLAGGEGGFLTAALPASNLTQLINLSQLQAAIPGNIVKFLDTATPRNGFTLTGTVDATNQASIYLPAQWTNSAVAASTGDYIAAFISSNTFSTIVSGIADVEAYCFENSAGSGSLSAEVYAVNSVSKIEEHEFTPSAAFQSVASGTTPTILAWSVPLTDYTSTTNFYMMVKFKVRVDSGASLTARIVTGGSFPSHFTLNVPSSFFQPAFTTGVGVTNVANVLSANYTPGANITFTTNAYGSVSIAGSAGAADNWSASGTTNSTLPGQAFMDSLRVTNNSQVAHIGVGVAADANTPLLVDRSGIGATPSDGITITNATAAGAGAQQYSPAIHFGGQGFKTDVTTGSQPLDWRVYVQPVQGAGNPTSQLNFDSSVNGAAFANRFQLLSNGGAISAASVSCGASSKFAWTGLSAMTAPLDGYIQLANTAGSGFTQLRLGVDSATPSATVTIRSGGSRGGTDTDTAGGSLLLSGSQGTGTGAGGAVKFATYGSSNSTGNAIGPQTIRAFASAKYVTLTESSATLIGNVAVPSGKILGVQMFCTVNANDATPDYQAKSSRVSFDAVNKGGTVTVGAVTQTDNGIAETAGASTLAVTYTAVANGNGVDIKCSATSSLTQTILQCRWHITSMNSDDVATVTPQ